MPLLGTMDVHPESIGDSTGKLEHLSDLQVFPVSQYRHVQALRIKPWVVIMVLASGGSALMAQPAFNGVTIVQRVYYNCLPGQAACEFGATTTDAWDQNRTHVSILNLRAAAKFRTSA